MDAAPEMDRHLEMLAQREDGSLCLATSSLTGATWRGSVWFFHNPNDAPEPHLATAWARSQCGNTDIAWLNERSLVTGSDDGAVELWEITDGNKALKLAAKLSQHDDIVQTISVNANGHSIVSGGWDSKIKVWNTEKECCQRSLSGHLDTVYAVACSPSNPHIFVSASEDGSTKLWDIRDKSEVRSVFSTGLHGVGVRSAAWQPGDNQRIAVGDARGRVVFLEIGKNCSNVITEFDIQRDAVNRLAFSPHERSWLASASNDGTVVVMNLAVNTIM
ncbi:methylosome protein WDR77-like isoform X2 [Corticium candelabrum]|uniref:methylosome protein WDR77-like isoform X2 n=1 Tax=Corticium candelabrum TaxID=121492 RepID=UPI002E25A7C8|nr:methylosome protein WDR77-like isoform X2 [Corticium candelabrum]